MDSKKILQISKLMEKEVSRQDFLKMTGILLLGIIGIPQLLSLINGSSGGHVQKKVEQTGYGSSPYGR